MNHVIGTCSICGGAVCVPTAWMGTQPPTPSCLSCGARAKQPHGPVIDMERRAQPSKSLAEELDATLRKRGWAEIWDRDTSL